MISVQKVLKNVLTANNHCPNTKGDNMDLVGLHTVASTINGNPDIPDISKSVLLVAKSELRKKGKILFLVIL